MGPAEVEVMMVAMVITLLDNVEKRMMILMKIEVFVR